MATQYVESITVHEREFHNFYNPLSNFQVKFVKLCVFIKIFVVTNYIYVCGT